MVSTAFVLLLFGAFFLEASAMMCPRYYSIYMQPSKSCVQPGLTDCCPTWESTPGFSCCQLMTADKADISWLKPGYEVDSCPPYYNSIYQTWTDGLECDWPDDECCGDFSTGAYYCCQNRDNYDDFVGFDVGAWAGISVAICVFVAVIIGVCVVVTRRRRLAAGVTVINVPRQSVPIVTAMPVQTVYGATVMPQPQQQQYPQPFQGQQQTYPVAQPPPAYAP